ncbi:hypothetical protein CYMTET_5041 [Cymbomonas tetramitiformis]|uniref:Uncharacterized protein n=1 Tax=Cymbomonas tetramitiformis TaxID=36881 RepID=A0AAE0H058_9CHLO|nr:hypothetical protein CYMTET_5041 [Cymbomonas tetramitiformis]
MKARIWMKHAISKSSEGLTLKEAVQLGFLRSSDLAVVVDELPPFDAVRYVEDYLATINLKSFNSEGVEREWKDPANTVMYKMDTPSPPSSEAEPILPVEVNNPGTPEKKPKLKEPMMPTPNASRLQLAKVQMSSMNTMVIDGGGNSATVANDPIGTEEEQFRHLPRREAKVTERRGATFSGPRKSSGGWQGGGYTRTPGLMGRPSGGPPDGGAEGDEDAATILLNLIGDLLLDLLSTHRVDLVDRIELEPYW